MSQGEQLLSRSERLAGRRRFLWFGVFNAASFNLLTGNLITLYLLRLGASRTTVGVIASFGFAAFLLSLVGRRLVPKLGLIRLFSLAWLLRYLFMLPAAAAPLLFSRFGSVAAVGAVGLGSLGFHVFRGLGLVANSPVTGALSDGPDRGAFLSSFQIRVAIASTLTGLVIVGAVDPAASLSRYALLLGTGVILGMVATTLMAGLPEPAGTGVGSSSAGVFEALGRALRDSQLRSFFVAFTTYAVADGIYRSFLVVTAKQVYGYSDRTAYLLTVIGFVGTLTMGLMSRLLTDKIGAKPMTLIFVSVIGAGTVPLILLPELAGVAGFLLLGALFFAIMLGVTGGETTAQAYFLALVPPRQRLELGLLFFLSLGLGGTVGSAVGGAVLDALSFGAGLEIGAAFRLFYLGALGLLLLAFLLFSRLEPMGAYSFRSALGVLFSLRDLRAINLVNQLEVTESIGADRRTIQRLGNTESSIAAEEIVRALESPSFVIRNEAIYALANVPWTEKVEDALISELERNEFTTAHAAARMLGKRGTRRAIEPLRHALQSEDYLLRAKAAVALGRFQDPESLSKIGDTLATSANPFVLIHAAAALRLYGERTALAGLFHALTRDDLDTYVVDEIIIDAASLLGLSAWFYGLYARFTRSPAEGAEEVGELLSGGDEAILDSLVHGAVHQATPKRADPESSQQDRLLGKLEELRESAPQQLREALSTVDLGAVRYPARLLLLLLAAHSVKDVTIE